MILFSLHIYWGFEIIRMDLPQKTEAPSDGELLYKLCWAEGGSAQVWPNTPTIFAIIFAKNRQRLSLNIFLVFASHNEQWRKIPCEHKMLCFICRTEQREILIYFYRANWSVLSDSRAPMEVFGLTESSDVDCYWYWESWVAGVISPWCYSETFHKSGSHHTGIIYAAILLWVLCNPIFFWCSRKSILISCWGLDDMILTDYPCSKFRIDLFVWWRLWEHFYADSGWEHFCLLTSKKIFSHFQQLIYLQQYLATIVKMFAE